MQRNNILQKGRNKEKQPRIKWTVTAEAEGPGLWSALIGRREESETIVKKERMKNV